MKISNFIQRTLVRFQDTIYAEHGKLVLLLLNGSVLRTIFVFLISFPIAYSLYDECLGLSRRRRAAYISGCIVTCIFSFFLLSAAWSPTLYIDLFYLLSPVIFEGYLTPPVSLIFLAIPASMIWYFSRIVRARNLRNGLLIVSAVYGVFIYCKLPPYEANLDLPENSIVILAGDSLRSDSISAEKSPMMFALRKKLAGVQLRGLVPPMESTVVSIASLFTGKLPQDSGVLSSFSKPRDLTKHSIVSEARARGYCTVGVGFYSNNAIDRNEFGFEFERDIISDFPGKYFSYFLLQRDPLLTMTLSMDAMYELSSLALRSAYDFISRAPTAIRGAEILESMVEDCGIRPVFAFVFFNEPHYEYPSTFPYYLEIPVSERKYSALNDSYSNGNKSAISGYLRGFYDNSVLGLDYILSRLVRENLTSANDNHATFIVLGDHGEYFGDQGHFFHANDLGPIEAGSAPFLLFGRGREIFRENASSFFQTTDIKAQLKKLISSGEDGPFEPGRPSRVLRRETEVWFFEEPNLPGRVRYPRVWDGLISTKTDGPSVIADEYIEITEYAKHRQWILDGDDIIEVFPGENRKHLVRRNGIEVDFDSLPEIVKTDVRNRSPRLACELSPSPCR